MAYARATAIAVDQIPVIDVSGLASESHQAYRQVAGELLLAAQTVGFFYIKNHSVPQTLIDQVLAIARTFFQSPLRAKQRIAITGAHRGFLGPGEAKMYGNKHPDLKESFVWGLDLATDDPDVSAGKRLLAVNRWPDFIPQMCPVYNRYFASVQRCGQQLLRAFATGLGIAPDYFTRTMDKPVSRASVIYYPPQPAELSEEHFGVSPHTDYGTLTLLYQDGVGGLQVRDREDRWLTAHPIAGSFVVNIGDLMARWSNNRFTSTPHRVINTSGRERYSVAMFIDPDWDTIIEPVITETGETARYEAVRCADYINARYDEAFRYRTR